MELLQGMRVTIGRKYAIGYGYDQIVGQVCTYEGLFRCADPGQLAEEDEVHLVTKDFHGKSLSWYVRRGDIYPADPITNELGIFYLNKEDNI